MEKNEEITYGITISSGADNITTAIESWNLPSLRKTQHQKPNLTNLSTLEKDLSPKKFLKSLAKVRNFTQLVWRNSTAIGCARTLCEDEGWLVVCLFDPKSNILGRFGENVQVSGSVTEAGFAAGEISAEKTRPDVGAIGESTNDGGEVIDKIQVWCVFIVVLLVVGAVFS